jgi:hypothetical protein
MNSTIEVWERVDAQQTQIARLIERVNRLESGNLTANISRLQIRSADGRLIVAIARAIEDAIGDQPEPTADEVAAAVRVLGRAFGINLTATRDGARK